MGVLLAVGVLSLLLNVVVLVGWARLRRQLEDQKLILLAINASEDISYILEEILHVMKRTLRVPLASSVVVIAEESQLRILYPSRFDERRVYRFFSSLTRTEMYQFLLQCVSLTRNIFATNVLGPNEDVSLMTLSLFQRLHNYHKGRYNYLVIPIYDKEIAGLVVFEAHPNRLFRYREAKRLQRSIPILNVGFSRILLLWNLRQQSITDPLTGLLNKRQFILMAEKLFSLTKRKNEAFAVVIIDIDRFKHINDSYGHHVGDIILKDVAEVLLHESRQADYLFRIGGDEFCLLFAEAPSAEDIQGYADRIHSAILSYGERKPDVVKETLSVSVGWAAEKDCSTWVEVFEKADKHMYEQKRKHHEDHWYS